MSHSLREARRFLPREGADTTQYMRPSPSCHLSPPSPAILGNPALLKQDTGKESHVLISSYPQSQDNPMANPRVILETTAEGHDGFPLMLLEVVCDLLGRPARPRYAVYESSLSPAGSEFRADVHIDSCPLGTSQSYVIQIGRAHV